MVPIFVIAGIAIGMAAFVLLIQMAVRNGIRMSGLIDWRTQYEFGTHRRCGRRQADVARIV